MRDPSRPSHRRPRVQTCLPTPTLPPQEAGLRSVLTEPREQLRGKRGEREEGEGEGSLPPSVATAHGSFRALLSLASPPQMAYVEPFAFS